MTSRRRLASLAGAADPRALWLRYLASLALIACVVAAFAISGLRGLEQARADALAVASSGGQESRLRRLVEAAEALAARPDAAARVALGQTLGGFEATHAELVASARAAGLSALVDGPRGLDALARGVAGDARRLLTGAPEPRAALERLRADGAGPAAARLRDLTGALDAHAAETARRARATAFALLGAAALAALGQAALVMRPALSAMRRAFARLARRGESLRRAREAAEQRAAALRAHVRRTEREARRDPLTGLANRRGFAEALQERLARHPGDAAVLHIDLDRFRQINEALGHAAGDAVLRRAAEVLREQAGPGALIARVGGDEFAVLSAARHGRAGLEALASRLIGALSLPMDMFGETCRVGASVGVADGRGDAERTTLSASGGAAHPAATCGAVADEGAGAADRSADAAGDGTADGAADGAADEAAHPAAAPSPTVAAEQAARMLAEAALALDAARRDGGMRCAFFSDALRARAARVKRLSDDLLAGLPRGEITPFYQPQFCARSLDIVGAEALARWRHPEFGMLPPFEFLEIAERLGALGEIDHAMLVAALADRARWAADGVAVGRVSVNVSTRRLQDEGLIESLRALDIPRGAVAFELLESSFLDVRAGAMAWNLDTLAEMGVDIEVDDFGTGHASIASVMAVQPRRLKIARELIRPITDSARQRDVVRAIVGIGRTLGAEITAEGVETIEHVRLARELGCDVLQGYALARPMPAEALVAFARDGAWREAG